MGILNQHAMSEARAPPESDLERIARTMHPAQSQAIAGIVYDAPQSVMVLDANYQFLLASRQAELLLGYNSDQIRMDSLRLQHEVFRRLEEVCREQFDSQKKTQFELKGVAYSSSDKETNFVLNAQVRKLVRGGAVVNLRKVSKRNYQQQEGDLVVTAPRFIDDHAGRKDLWTGLTFEDKLNAAYLSAAQGKRVIIDLARTDEITYTHAKALAHKSRDAHNILFLNARPAIYDALHMNGGGVPADRFYYDTAPVLAPRPA
jgi:hypothetical protein